MFRGTITQAFIRSAHASQGYSSEEVSLGTFIVISGASRRFWEGFVSVKIILRNDAANHGVRIPSGVSDYAAHLLDLHCVWWKRELKHQFLPGDMSNASLKIEADVAIHIRSLNDGKSMLQENRNNTLLHGCKVGVG